MNGESIKNCFVIGINGQFGAIFATKLAAGGVSVGGMDLQPALKPGGPCQSYLQGSITDRPSDDIEAALREADCVILCIPEQAIVSSLPTLSRLVRPEALIVDIASVKTRIDEAFLNASPPSAYLSIHPMFGPTADFSGRAVCVVVLRDSAKAQWFLELVQSWKPTVTIVTAKEHDNATALVQTLPHAALISFGATLAESALPFDLVWRVATPIQKLMLALLIRIVDEDPGVYWSIQAINPYSVKVRDALIGKVAAISALVGSGSEDRFAALLASIESFISPARSELWELSRESVEIAKSDEAS